MSNVGVIVPRHFAYRYISYCILLENAPRCSGKVLYLVKSISLGMPSRKCQYNFELV